VASFCYIMAHDAMQCHLRWQGMCYSVVHSVCIISTQAAYSTHHTSCITVVMLQTTQQHTAP
jgi:hypothetical protein